jgi:hypothetical protein
MSLAHTPSGTYLLRQATRADPLRVLWIACVRPVSPAAWGRPTMGLGSARGWLCALFDPTFTPSPDAQEHHQRACYRTYLNLG